MFPFWLMFLLPAFASLHNGRVRVRPYDKRFWRLSRGWLGVVIILTLLIGLRVEVGGDWGNYLRNLQVTGTAIDMWAALRRGDPGYRMLEWFSYQWGWGIYGVNLIGGAIFAFGLVVFCREQPRPWLALTVAVPYLVIVVGMGYSRQGIALGLGLLGLRSLGRARPHSFVSWVVLGATVHKSVVLLLPIAALAATRRRLWSLLWVGLVCFGAYDVLIEPDFERLYANYIVETYQSQGALMRLSMNAVPALILLFYRKKFHLDLPQERLWWLFALFSIFLLALFFVIPNSTAIDRVALILIPLQLAVFSHVPEVFGKYSGRNGLFVIAVLIYYALVQFVWLNYATHAKAWIPYRNLLFE